LELNTSNSALSGDIEKVIVGIHALADKAAMDVEANDAEGDSVNHVLLAGYQQQGKPH